MAYAYRKLDPDEFDILVPLMRDCFGMDTNIEYFRWKYLANPAGSFLGFIAVEEETGAVGAYYGVIPEQYVMDGEIRTLYQSCDTMTHSAHRRRGLFQKLALLCYQHLRERNELFVIGFGGAQSTPGFLKFGWKEVFQARFYVYPALFQKIALGQFLWKKAISHNVVAVSDVSVIADLLQKSNDTARMHSLRLLPIYSWRIANPQRPYQVIAYRAENGHFSGYITFHMEADKIFVLDFYFENSRTGKVLFAALKNKLRRGDRGIVTFCQEQSSFAAQLRRYGFLNNPFKKGPLSTTSSFIIYSDEERMAQYKDPSLWSLNAFDHDSM